MELNRRRFLIGAGLVLAPAVLRLPLEMTPRGSRVMRVLLPKNPEWDTHVYGVPAPTLVFGAGAPVWVDQGDRATFVMDGAGNWQVGDVAWWEDLNPPRWFLLTTDRLSVKDPPDRFTAFRSRPVPVARAC